MSDHLKPLIFCIGLVKTGTSSLLEALNILGWPGCNDIPAMQDSWTEFFNNVSTVPLGGLTNRYRAFSQNPVALLYSALSAWYPEAKFILTERDTNQVIASMLIHVAWNRLHPEPKPSHVASWTNLTTSEDEGLYPRHSKQVRAFFEDKPVPLLIMDVTQAPQWEPLCEFLQVPVPAPTFPHFNHYKGR